MAPIKEWFGTYNIIYKWFEEKHGAKALEEYWKFIAESCFNEVVDQFNRDGIEGIRDYFSETFDMDDGEYKSSIENGSLIFEVTKCPDYDFMKSATNSNFKPIHNYCKHHDVINSVLAAKAGYSFCMTECNNDGQCKWLFEKKDKGFEGGNGLDSK